MEVSCLEYMTIDIMKDGAAGKKPEHSLESWMTNDLNCLYAFYNVVSPHSRLP